MSADLFGRLISRLEEEGFGLATSAKARWLKRLSDPDAELMAKADVETLVLSRRARVASVNHEDATYFIFRGFPPSPDYIPGLDSVPATPGLFTIAVTELDLLPRAPVGSIRDAIEDFHGELPGYEGHDLDTIADLFPRLQYFRASPDYEFTSSLVRTAGSFVSHSYQDGPLHLSSDTKAWLQELFEAGNIYIPFPLILQGMMSFSWTSFYLEAYRCIEQMFSVPRVSSLVANWPTNLSHFEVAELLERHLSWRPKEDESLAKIIEFCSPDSVQTVVEAFGIETSQETENVSRIAARAIYDLRNGLVHFRPSKSSNSLSDDSWNKVIIALISCISDIYEATGRDFHTSPAASGGLGNPNVVPAESITRTV
jgi:hypothetical protein